MELINFNLAYTTFSLTVIWVTCWVLSTNFRNPHGQSAWNFCGYTIMTGIGLFALSQADIMYGFWDVRRLLFSDFTPTTSGMMLYAQFQCAWYIAALFGLVFERSAKDYYIMMTHHICTIGLIITTFSFGYYTHVASLVMVLHDISDIFLHAAKLLRYAKFGVTVDVTFGIFTITFLVTRLIIYPQTLLWAIIGRVDGDGGPDLTLWTSQALIIGNSILILLHLYWFVLICRMIFTFARKGHVPDDIRDEKQD